MKKVLFNALEGVNIESITNSSSVGIIFAAGVKVWVMEQTREKFMGIKIGDSNFYSVWTEKDKKDYCISAHRMGAEVFVFNSHEDLIEWLKK